MQKITDIVRWDYPLRGRDPRGSQGIAKTANRDLSETVQFKATVPVNQEIVCGDNSMRRRPNFNDLDLSLTRISRSPDASIVNISEIKLGRPTNYIFSESASFGGDLSVSDPYRKWQLKPQVTGKTK